MAKNTKRENFARALCKLYENFDNPKFDVEEYSRAVMSAFLGWGKGALDQEHYGEIIEFGKASINDPDEEIYGFKVKGQDAFLYLIINLLEAIPLPSEVQERFPDMTQEEWQAAMRVTTGVLAAFSPSKPKLS